MGVLGLTAQNARVKHRKEEKEPDLRKTQLGFLLSALKTEWPRALTLECTAPRQGF